MAKPFSLARVLLLTVLALLGCARSSMGQVPSEETPARAVPAWTQWPISVQVSAGYTNAHLGDARDAYRSFVGEYRRQGIAIPTQRAMPAAPLFEVALYYEAAPFVRIGLSGQRFETRAYSRYGDYAGTLDVDGAASFWALGLGSELGWPLSRRFHALFEGRALLLSTRFGLSDRIAFDGDYGFVEGGASSAEISALGLGNEAMGGLGMQAGRFTAEVRAGYRYARFYDEEQMPFALNLSGFFIRTAFGFGNGSQR